MKKILLKKVTIGFTLAVFVTILTAGCDRYTKHKILTFFFTGVPAIEEEGVLPKEEAKTPIDDKRKEKRLPPPIASFVHGPYGAVQCHLCHETAATVGFRKFDIDKEKPEGIPKLGGVVPGRLVAPLKNLCIECHTLKSAALAYSTDLWMHGPAADGSCIECHSPHRSPFQYMLLKEKSIELCTQCHTKGYISEIKEHKEEEGCSSCHNPHMGKDRFLLKKVFNEVF